MVRQLPNLPGHELNKIIYIEVMGGYEKSEDNFNYPLYSSDNAYIFEILEKIHSNYNLYYDGIYFNKYVCKLILDRPQALAFNSEHIYITSTISMAHAVCIAALELVLKVRINND